MHWSSACHLCTPSGMTNDSLQEERRDGILRTRATQNTRQTTPVFLNHCHACPGCFPLQPMEEHEKNLQLSVVSSTDINVVLSVAMQRLSLKVSVLPNVQHEPQSTVL